MRAMLKTPFGVPPWTAVVIVLVCLLIGAVIPGFADGMGYRPGRLAALPAVLLFGVLMIYDYRKLVMVILVLRSVGDVALESTSFSIGGLNMGIGGVINLVVIMIAGLMVINQPQIFPTRLVRFWIPVLLMMGFGVMTSFETSGAIKIYLGMLSYFSIFIISVYTVRSYADFNKIISLVLWSSVLPTIYSFVDVALHMRNGGFRLSSTFSHPNILGFYLTLMLVLCLYMLKSPLFKIGAVGRIVVSIYVPVLLVQLLLTQTRSAWLACVLIFGLYALLFERKYLLYLLLVPLVVIFIPSVHDRLMQLGGNDELVRYAPLNSFAWRVVLWKSAIGWMEPLRLIYGYGLDDFIRFSPVFFTLDHSTNWDAHNVYVQLFFEMGAVGLLCYLWLYARVLWTIRMFARIDRLSGFLLVAVVLQYLIVSFSDNMFRYLVFNWYFWFIVGGACSLVELQVRSRSAPTRMVNPN